MASRTHPADSRTGIAILAMTLLSGALLCLPWLWPATRHLDFLWLDTLVAQVAANRQGDPEIVLIDIDDYSLQALAPTIGRWPWPRATHAELVEWLEAQGARAIAFDIWFSEPDVLRPEFDTYFGEVLDRYPNIFLPTLIMNTADPGQARRLDSYPSQPLITRLPDADPDARAELLLPVMGSPQHWRLGLINYQADADGIARHYQVIHRHRGWQLLSLPHVMATQLGYLPAGTDIPDQWRIAWHGTREHPPYASYSYADIWQRVQTGQPDPALHGKIVFIGSTAAGLHDVRPTPLDGQYPGLYLMAHAFDNLKNGESLAYHPALGLAAGCPLLVLLGGLLWRQRSLYAITVAYAASSLALLLASAWLSSQSWLLPAVSPVLAGLLLLGGGAALRYLEERRGRQAAIDLFGRFLDPVVVNQLASEGLNEQTLAGQDCTISVLFSDIRGFTTLSEKSTAAYIMNLLNAYFTRQVGVIFRHRGTLDKFIGDAIMAFWGAPVADPNHAIDAVSAALDMVDELLRFREEHGLPDFDVGIGIHSGPAVVGMLGCDQRLEYTAIGDTVNLRSRLEGITKGIARILVSQATRDLCGDHFEFIAHGSCSVKGRAEPVNIYEPRRKPA